MKKLTLLLAALSVASAAYAKEVMPAAAEVKAAPALTVTSVGQSIEIDNTSGAEDIGEEFHFANSVGLAYGDDWTFGLMARKTWSMDTDKGIHQAGHRIDLDAWKSFGDYSLGLRYRSEADKDQYYLRGKYSYGMFSGWADLTYKAMNDGDENDAFFSEGMPVAVTYGPVKVGYYYWMNSVIGDLVADEVEKEVRHQVRVMAPIWSNDKLSFAGEYRYQFAHDKDLSKGSTDGWQENNRHIAILSGNYAVTEALSVSGYYEYDFNQYDGKDGAKDQKSDEYYGEFGLGWSYAF